MGDAARQTGRSAADAGGGVNKPVDFDAEAMMDAMAACLGLTLEPGYRDGVAAHLMAAHAIAQDVLAFELDDEAEPAPVYRP